MPIYEFECNCCGKKYEKIMTHKESEDIIASPCCPNNGRLRKIISLTHFRMNPIFDNAIAGPEGLFGNKHDEYKEKSEESEMNMRKRQEIIENKGERGLVNHVFSDERPLSQDDDF